MSCRRGTRSPHLAAVTAALTVGGWCMLGGAAWADPLPPPPGPKPGPPAPGSAAPAPSPPAPAAPAPAAPAGPAPKTVIDSDGSYTVGTDIAPGTYRSAGPAGGSPCYWKRVNGDQIIDNALTKKPQVVQIEPTDTLFKTDRCQPWQQVECPPDCATPEQPPPGLPGNMKDFLEHPPQPPAGR